ncbi:MAG: Na/Pi symporter [Sandaracinaceae bacterium]
MDAPSVELNGALIATVVGGVGLFLLGMRLMTEGLKVAAGKLLRDLLARWTRDRPRALLAGVLMTALVQSSSAVTVAAIGFVNAGLLDLGRALWVVFGSNVGTTMTAWLVALTGFEVDLEAFALPMIGVGMLLGLGNRGRRRAALGEALAGFGLFFLGLGILKAAFDGLGAELDLASLKLGGPLSGLVFFGLGALLTVIMQSSSAALALTLTTAAGGLIDLQDAGAMVVGANLGTTSTAAFAAVGATSAAKRTAVGHVAFNLLAAVVALALLPWLLDAMLLLLGDQTPLPTLLALFHTVFNLLGVLLMWPLSGRLRVWLERRFVSEDEKKGEPRHLDANVLSVPALAIESLTLEMRRAGRHAGEIVGLALRAPAADRAVVERRIERFHHLMDAIGEGFSALDRAQLSDATAGTLALLIRTSRHYYTAVEQAAALLTLREADTTRAARFDGPLGEALHRVITLANPEREGFRLSDADEALGVLEERYQHDRKSLIAAATRGEASAGPSMTSYHLLAEARRAVRHLVRAAEDLPLSDSKVSGDRTTR